MRLRHKFRRTTLLSAGLVAFLIGLLAARWQVETLSYGWLIATVPLALLAKRKSYLALIAVLLTGYILGLVRGGYTLDELKDYQKFFNQKVTLIGNVKTDPVYDDRGRYDFRVSNIQINNERLPGEVRVRAFVNDLKRGDSVEAKGGLRTGFSNYQAEISFADVAVINRSGNGLEKIRRNFFASTYSVLPEPQASLGLGFLVGLRSSLPEQFDEQLRITGLTHIVVASGYNLTILVRMCRRLAAKRSKYQAFISSVALVLLFVLITGASPSIVRAAVVTLLSLIAWYFGRKVHPVLLLLLGAGITAGANPIYIWYDLGWWLSFLAFAGVLILAPLLTNSLFKSKTPPALLQIAIETVSAQALALPLILYTFGQFSVISLVANLAVVPLIPYAMLATFVAGLVGSFSLVLGGWLAVPAKYLLGYVVSVTQILSKPGWAQVPIQLNSAGLVLIYISIAITMFGLIKRSNFSFREAPSVIE